jgi:hypothetical protein
VDKVDNLVYKSPIRVILPNKNVDNFFVRENRPGCQLDIKRAGPHRIFLFLCNIISEQLFAQLIQFILPDKFQIIEHAPPGAPIEKTGAAASALREGGRPRPDRLKMPSGYESPYSSASFLNSGRER